MWSYSSGKAGYCSVLLALVKQQPETDPGVLELAKIFLGSSQLVEQITGKKSMKRSRGTCQTDDNLFRFGREHECRSEVQTKTDELVPAIWVICTYIHKVKDKPSRQLQVP